MDQKDAWAKQQEENARMFPTADQMRGKVFDLKAWVMQYGEKIKKDLKSSRRAIIDVPDESDRKQIRAFFESLGYKVDAGRDHQGENSTLIISL